MREEARVDGFVEEGTRICRGGHMDLHRRMAHGFAPKEGTQLKKMV
jgi:hypothetical protein